MTFALALLFGMIVGLSLGALGGGGSILVVPALVYVLKVPLPEATHLSQIVVGSTSLFALLFRWRSGCVQWRTAMFLAFVGAGGAMLGREAVRAASDATIMICLGIVSITIATLMLQRSFKAKRHAQNADQLRSGDGRTGSLPVSGSPKMLGLISAAGAGVGFLTGFLGVGGGFLTVPILVLAMRFPMQPAIGTSLMVIALNCTSSLLYDGMVEVRWDLALPFMIVAMICSSVGYRASRHLSEAALQRSFAVMIMLLGTAILVGNLIGG